MGSSPGWKLAYSSCQVIYQNWWITASLKNNPSTLIHFITNHITQITWINFRRRRCVCAGEQIQWVRHWLHSHFMPAVCPCVRVCACMMQARWCVWRLTHFATMRISLWESRGESWGDLGVLDFPNTMKSHFAFCLAAWRRQSSPQVGLNIPSGWRGGGSWHGGKATRRICGLTKRLYWVSEATRNAWELAKEKRGGAGYRLVEGTRERRPRWSLLTPLVWTDTQVQQRFKWIQGRSSPVISSSFVSSP